MSELDRAAALAALTGADPAGEPTAVSTGTGNTVYAGGDIPRVLLIDAGLTWRSEYGLERVTGLIGDQVLVTAEQAERLDRLGFVVDPDLPVDLSAAVTPAEDSPVVFVADTVPLEAVPLATSRLEANAGIAPLELAPSLGGIRIDVMTAKELVAAASDSADAAAAIREAELSRPASERRKTVLDATAPPTP